MSHDELLAAIEEHQNDYSPQATDVTAWDALRAVVELHKPYGIDQFPNLKSMCGHCAHLTYQLWPCPTIEAIERELNQ